MSTFEVDSAQLESTARRMGATADVLRSAAASMLADLHGLEGTWRGQAASAFRQLAEQWHAIQTGVEHSLVDIEQALTATARSYDDAEQQAARLFAA